MCRLPAISCVVGLRTLTYCLRHAAIVRCSSWLPTQQEDQQESGTASHTASLRTDGSRWWHQSFSVVHGALQKTKHTDPARCSDVKSRETLPHVTDVKRTTSFKSWRTQAVQTARVQPEQCAAKSVRRSANLAAAISLKQKGYRHGQAMQ